jgi:hypothetical protein
MNRSSESGRGLPHCYELCQHGKALGTIFFIFFFLLLKASSLFSFPGWFRFAKRFPGGGNGFSRCSSCYPCSASLSCKDGTL